MRLKALPFALATVLTLTIATTYAGGWAVTTIEHLPQQFVVGQPTPLKFSVRQHGMRLLSGLNSSVTATLASGRAIRFAGRSEGEGYYSASLAFPEPGEWTITVYSGFGPGALTLMPVKVVAAGTAPRSIPAADRGQQLFIAKGCNTCHYHDATKTRPIVPVAADLTDKRYSDALLTKILQDPTIVQPTGIWTMPNLNLDQQEVAALVAFINKPRPRP
jgi:cytochrome c551/c552